ncbi:hypothetical protein KJ780_04925 [Candidatus Micrarchaeota archaeon]|nr:hypothetical protein [Candidatus Micrarchaeota archaeon]
MIEDEIIHWWKDEKGEQHRTIFRIESDEPTQSNGFPRDGLITVRVVNTVSATAIKLSPSEALQVSTQLLSVAKELMNKKRRMWQSHED